MGYYIRITDCDAALPESAFDEAYARLVELNSHDEWKRGGGWSNGVKNAKWFSWMPQDYPDKYETVSEILSALGFQLTAYDGGIAIHDHNDKVGSEDVFIWYISDLFEENSYMDWKGEDGEEYRWEFGGGKKLTQAVGKVVWSKQEPFEPFEWEKFLF